jgi:nicotinamidase-related amidase
MAGINLLIIDPQNDFHEGGSLPVAGATNDSKRIADFIQKLTKAAKLNRVFVSLDTHTGTHIGHAGFWESESDQSEPGAFTAFSVDNNNQIVGSDSKVYKPTRYADEFNNDDNYNQRVELVKQYIKKLIAAKKFTPVIWPTHCIEGDKGHKVNEVLKKQLDNISNKVEYHIKGQNEWAEMYSIFKAEYPVEELVGPNDINEKNIKKYYRGNQTKFKETSKIDISKSDEADGVYLQTTFNKSLYESLTKESRPIYICGEALSHCVNWSLRDLVTQLLKDNNENYVENGKIKPGMVVLLSDCSSKVTLPTDEYYYSKVVFDLFDFCETNGVTTRDASPGTFIPILGGSKRTRRARGGAYKPRTKKSNMRKRKTNKRKNKKRRNTKK